MQTLTEKPGGLWAGLYRGGGGGGCQPNLLPCAHLDSLYGLSHVPAPVGRSGLFLEPQSWIYLDMRFQRNLPEMEQTENSWPRANQVWSGYHIALDGASTCATHLSIQLTFFSDSNSIKFSQKNLKSQVISVNIMPFHVFSVKATDPLIPDAAGPALLVTSIGAGPEVRQC